MTANSIAYANYLETARHNAVMERLESVKREIEKRSVDIQERKNHAEYLIGRSNLRESARHNTRTEELTKWKDEVNAYLQHLNRQETERHNLALESISKEGNQVSWMNANTNRFNAETNQGHLEETKRANREHERLTARGQDFGVNAAKISAGATMYAAQQNAAASRYVADTNYAATQYSSQLKYLADNYATDAGLTSSAWNVEQRERANVRDNTTKIFTTKYKAFWDYKGVETRTAAERERTWINAGVSLFPKGYRTGGTNSTPKTPKKR